MIKSLLLAVSLFAAPVLAQTTPINLPMFPEPPEDNGADPVPYANGILYNSGLACLQSTKGDHWECMVKSSELDAVSAVATAAQASAASAATAASAAQSTATSAATAASGAQSTANAAQTAASSAGTAAAAAQSTANSASTAAATAQSAASAAQTTANAAQSAASTNASDIAALVTRVGVAEGLISTLQSQVTALNALPRRLCTTTTLTGLSIPLTGGLSSTQNVTLAGVPVGTTCTVSGSSRPPAGATGSPVVTTAGVVNVAFVGGGGLLSGIIAIPSGTYRVCCDS